MGSRMIAYMLFPMYAMPFSPVCIGGEGSFRTFGTFGSTGNTTTHTAERGT